MSRGYEEARAAHNAARPEPHGETLAERVAALADEWTNKADDASLKSANCVSDDDSDHWHAVSENYTHFAAGVRALLAPVPAEPEVARIVWTVSGDLGAACGVYATEGSAHAAVEAHFMEYASGVTVEERVQRDSHRWEVYFRIGSMPYVLGKGQVLRQEVRQDVTPPADDAAPEAPVVETECDCTCPHVPVHHWASCADRSHPAPASSPAAPDEDPPEIVHRLAQSLADDCEDCAGYSAGWVAHRDDAEALIARREAHLREQIATEIEAARAIAGEGTFDAGRNAAVHPATKSEGDNS